MTLTKKESKVELSLKTKEKNMKPKWVDAIIGRLEDEPPYDEDNAVVTKAVRHYLEGDLSRCEEFMGTLIIEEGYFDELN